MQLIERKEPLIRDKKTNLQLTYKQATNCFQLVLLLEGALRHLEISGQAISLYLPNSVITEMKDLIKEIEDCNAPR